MRVVTRAVYEFGENWYDWVLVAENTRLHVGPVAHCKGPSNEMKDISSQQAAFSKTLIGNYNTQFANQQAVFNAIRSVYDPIMKAGPGQFGFTHDEESALRTSASESTARNYHQAGKAVSEQLAARGGGNSFLPSGAEAQIQGEIAGAAAESESQKQLGVTEAGYDVGRQQFRDASNIEMGVAAGYNPLGYADAASKSGEAAFGMASKIREMQNASSPWGLIGGLAGGVLGSMAGPIGTKLGGKLGGFLGNAGSGNSGGGSDGGWGVV